MFLSQLYNFCTPTSSKEHRTLKYLGICTGLHNTKRFFLTSTFIKVLVELVVHVIKILVGHQRYCEKLVTTTSLIINSFERQSIVS